MKTLLIDMDGTLCDYTGRMLRLAHERYDLPLYDPRTISLFNTETVFGEAWAEKIEELSTERGFFAELAPYPYAISALQEMRSLRDEYGVEVVICSAPKRVYKNPFCVQEKTEWVLRHLGRDYADGMILARDKTLVNGSVLVDDKPTITGCCTPTWIHVHFAQKYNEGMGNCRLTSWRCWRKELLPLLVV